MKALSGLRLSLLTAFCILLALLFATVHPVFAAPPADGGGASPTPTRTKTPKPTETPTKEPPTDTPEPTETILDQADIAATQGAAILAEEIVPTPTAQPASPLVGTNTVLGVLLCLGVLVVAGLAALNVISRRNP